MDRVAVVYSLILALGVWVVAPMGSASAADEAPADCCSHAEQTADPTPEERQTPADQHDCDGCGFVCCVKPLPLSSSASVSVGVADTVSPAAADAPCLVDQRHTSSLLRPPRV